MNPDADDLLIILDFYEDEAQRHLGPNSRGDPLIIIDEDEGDDTDPPVVVSK